MSTVGIKDDDNWLYAAKRFHYTLKYTNVNITAIQSKLIKPISIIAQVIIEMCTL